jgi:hypothetical protein
MRLKYLQLLIIFFIFAFYTNGAKAQVVSPILETPPDLEDNVPLSPQFCWDNIKGASFYEIVVYKDNENEAIINVFTVMNSYSDPVTVLDANTTYYWKIRGFSFFNTMEWSGTWEFTTSDRGSNKGTGGNQLPKVYSLHQNYPNPFNPVTQIKFELPGESLVSLKVFDITGKEIGVLADGILAAGYHEVNWNAVNVGSGVYFYRLDAQTLGSKKVIYKEMRKMIVVK